MRVPADLVGLVGKAVQKTSLRTKDRDEAKKRHAEKLAALLARWDGYRQGARTLTPRQINEIAGEFYRSMTEDAKERQPSALFTMSAIVTTLAFVDNSYDPGFAQSFHNLYGRKIDEYLWTRGMLIDRRLRKHLDVQVAKAIADALRQNGKILDGDFSPDPVAEKYPLPPPPPPPPPEVLSLEECLKDWSIGLAPATEKRWRPVIRDLMDGVGHDDLAKVTKKDVAGWIKSLEERGRAPKTIREVNLASCRSLFEFLIGRDKLTTNPAAGLKVKVPKKAKLRNKSFTDEEARKILAATLTPPPAQMSRDQAAARRWIPWICAYTGARVNEITQMRGQDVKKIEGIWAFHITPEAGTVKNNEFRDVPIHEHLIAQGFLEFVKKSGQGPLFYDPDRGRGGSDANPIYKKTGERLAAWVRQLGVKDKAVQPNHGWRHLFKTLGELHDLRPRVLNALQGHAPQTVAEKYGEVKMVVMARELAKIPRFDIDAPTVSLTAPATK
jgi:integrase